MDVVVAADSAYSVPLHACVWTVAHHCRGARLHVLDCGLSWSDRDSLRRTVGESGSVDFVPVSQQALVGLPPPACGSMATYARLLIAEFVEGDRVVYLDADTITRSALDELVGMDLGDSAVAAVREMYTPTVSSPNGVSGWRECGLEENTPYFNAGVMLIDLALWSDLEVGNRALAYLRRTDLAINLFDQEALNVTLAGNWAQLPQVWNVSRFWYKAARRTHPYESILDDAKVFHYLSDDKPWVMGNNVPEQQVAEFFSALDAGALAGWRPS